MTARYKRSVIYSFRGIHCLQIGWVYSECLLPRKIRQDMHVANYISMYLPPPPSLSVSLSLSLSLSLLVAFVVLLLPTSFSLSFSYYIYCINFSLYYLKHFDICFDFNVTTCMIVLYVYTRGSKGLTLIVLYCQEL